MNKEDELEEINLQMDAANTSTKRRRNGIKFAKLRVYSFRDNPKWKRQLKSIKSAKTRTSK